MSRCNIEEKKMISQLLNDVEKDAKPECCLLCGKKIDSFCNSHVVPRFVLKEIADNGMISYGQSLYNESMKNPLYNTTKGINNAFTFKLICNQCDKKTFAEYEDPKSVMNFETLNYDMKNLVLSEMAIKTHLEHIGRKSKDYILKCKTHPEMVELFRNVGTAEEIDIVDHLDYIKKLLKNRKSTSFPFRILYDKLLDYRCDIACQTLICYIYDLKGNKIYEPKDFSSGDYTRYFYLMILPYKAKTRVLFYIEKRNVQFVENIVSQFNELTEDEKLHFLFISLIIFEESFYIRPSLKENMLKDRKLIKLYKETDNLVSFDSCIKIKDFRKYNNYLLEQKQK